MGTPIRTERSKSTSDYLILSSNPFVLFLLVLLLYSLTLLFAPLRIIDDAYISFRYALNFRFHHELVFNLGERVEGITNLLWTLVLSVTNGDLAFRALSLSVVTNLWTLYRLWRLGESLELPHFASAFIAASLAINTQFILATTNGLEAGLYSMILCEICVQLSRDRRCAAALLVGLLFMTRPDGITAFPGFMLSLYILGCRRRAWIYPMLALCAIPVMVTAFRVIYYHDWLPNSVVAKAYPIQEFRQLLHFGFKYILGFLQESGYWLMLPMMALGSYRYLWNSLTIERRAVLAFSVLTVMSSWAVVLRNGGDWMPNFRLLAQYMPLLACISMITIVKRVPRAWIMFIIFLWPLTWTGLSIKKCGGRIGQFSRSGSINDFWNESASRLKPLVGADDVISAEALGFISFQLLNVRMHDPVGLTDKYIARHGQPMMLYGKVDSQYTLSVVSPTVALWHYTGHLSTVPPEVLQRYRTWRFGPDAGTMSTIMMIRNDQVDRLLPAVQGWTEIEALAIPR